MELSTPIYNKTERLLTNNWMTRSGLAEKLFLSEQQVSGIIVRLRAKGVAIISRPSSQCTGCLEYSIGTSDSPLASDYTARSIKSTKDMLIVEINRIRIEAHELKILSIENMAIQALNASGIHVE